MKKKKLLLDINDKPPILKWFILSLQHVFAMFSATVLVPLQTGLPVSVALFSSGIGTLIYILCTPNPILLLFELIIKCVFIYINHVLSPSSQYFYYRI